MHAYTDAEIAKRTFLNAVYFGTSLRQHTLCIYLFIKCTNNDFCPLSWNYFYPFTIHRYELVFTHHSKGKMALGVSGGTLAVEDSEVEDDCSEVIDGAIG